MGVEGADERKREEQEEGREGRTEIEGDKVRNRSAPLALPSSISQLLPLSRSRPRIIGTRWRQTPHRRPAKTSARGRAELSPSYEPQPEAAMAADKTASTLLMDAQFRIAASGPSRTALKA